MREVRRSGLNGAGSGAGVVPAVLVSVGLLVIVSRMTPASPDEKWAPFFDAGAGVESGGARS